MKRGLNCKEGLGTEPESGMCSETSLQYTQKNVFWEHFYFLLKDNLEAPALSGSGEP